MTNLTLLPWTMARVGCHWTAGDFAISSVVTGSAPYTFPGSYYQLRRNREEAGRYNTLAEAKAAAAEMAARS